MYKFLLSIVILQLSFILNAQTFAGRVLDVNKQPIEGVLVYLDNTSIITQTNANGNFILQNPKNINSNIVFRLMGYQTLITAPKSQMIVVLQEDVSELEELVIKKSKFSRVQLLNVFKEQFLGTTDFGKACKILNEDDLELSYDPDTFILETTCNKPIKIYNPLLGYNIEFDLKESKTFFNCYSLHAIEISKNVYFGTTLFKDADFVSEVAFKNRIQAYKGSIKNFFYDLTHNIEGKKNFILFKGSFSEEFKKIFEVTPAPNSGFIVKVIDPTYKKINNVFNPRYNLLYKNKIQSFILLSQQEIYVDEYGNYDPVQSVMVGGEMSKHRLGNMLPLNFEFKE